MPKRQANRNNDEDHRSRFAHRATEFDRAGDQYSGRSLLLPFVVVVIQGAARANEARRKPARSSLPVSTFARHATRLWPAIGVSLAHFLAMSFARRTHSALVIAV